MTVFNATLEAVTTTKSKTVVKLSLSNKEAAIFAQRYLASVDKELRVSFDDPQMEMDIQPTAGGRPGLVVTTDHNGVVETVKQQEIGDDDQADLFEQDGVRDFDGKEIVIKGLEEGTEYVFRIVDGEAEYPFKWVNGERVLGMNVNEVKDEIGPLPLAQDGPTRYMIEELLTAFGGELRDIVTDSEEVEFEDGEASTEPDPSDDDDQEDSEGAPDAEAIEEYILAEKPEFVEVPYNFAELLRRRREEDIRWIDLAKETGVTSGKLQAAYQTYKKLVVKKMRQQGVA